MTSPLTVTHVWDLKVACARDLHTELQRYPDVDSRQYIHQFVAKNPASIPKTFAYRLVTPTNGYGGLPTRLWARMHRPLSMRRYRAFVARHLPRSRPAVLHAHFGTTGWLFSDLAVRHDLSLVVTFYGVDVSQMVRTPSWQRRYVELFRRAARLVILCEEARDRLIALGCPADKIRIWNHPLDLDTYVYKPRTPQRTIRLLTAARFVEKKGYPFVLQACAELVRAGRDITLTAIGYGALREEIGRQAIGLGLEGRFRLIDTTGMDDFDTFYNQLLQEHDIFVLASTTARSGDDEGGPALSLVLAQAAGLPVICTPFPGAQRTVSDGETGLFCGQDDARSLAERIAYLADRPALWNQLGAAGNRLVRRQFDFSRQVDAMVEIYYEAVTAPANETPVVAS